MLYVSTPPEDAAPEDRSDSKGEPVDRQPGDKVDDADLGPWFALLRVAVGNRMPEGPLGPDTVHSEKLCDLTLAQVLGLVSVFCGT